MTKRVRFLTDCRQAGVIKYEAGKHYPLTPETQNQAFVHGNAEFIDVEMDEQQAADEEKAAVVAWVKTNERTVRADPELRRKYRELL